MHNTQPNQVHPGYFKLFFGLYSGTQATYFPTPQITLTPIARSEVKYIAQSIRFIHISTNNDDEGGDKVTCCTYRTTAICAGRTPVNASAMSSLVTRGSPQGTTPSPHPS